MVANELSDEKETWQKFTRIYRKDSFPDLLLIQELSGKKIIAEERQNRFGESSPVFYDRIHFVAEGK